MAVGDIKYTYSFLVQTMNVDSGVEKGDILVQGATGDDYHLETPDANDDPTHIDGVAVEDEDDGEARVLLTGVVEVDDDPDMFDTNDWEDVSNITLLNNYKLETEDDNEVILVR